MLYITSFMSLLNIKSLLLNIFPQKLNLLIFSTNLLTLKDLLILCILEGFA